MLVGTKGGRVGSLSAFGHWTSRDFRFSISKSCEEKGAKVGEKRYVLNENEVTRVV